MSESRFSLRKGMLLVAFGVGLYCILQNLGAVADGVNQFLGRSSIRSSSAFAWRLCSTC